MSRSIFIQNTAGLAASDPALQNPDDVADGKVVLLGIDGGGAVGLGAAQNAAPKRFHVVRGTATGNARRSHIINKADIESVEFEAYRAPQAQVTTITPTAGSVAEGNAILKVTRLDQGFEQYPRANYEIDVESGDSATDIVTKLKNAITTAKSIASPVNGITKHIVTASGTSTLILTAITPELHTEGTPVQEHISFVTGLDGDAVGGWTIASTTAPDPGSGSYGQVYEYEGKSFGNFGFYYTETPYAQRPAHHADSGTTYDLVTLQVKNDADRAINRSFEIHEVTIAVAAGELDEQTVVELFGHEFEGSVSP